jgi:hypothetical protein
MKKRITRLVAVALITAAMMAATAAPALAVTPYDCRDTAYSVYYGEELDAQDLQLISQYPTLQACIQDSV